MDAKWAQIANAARADRDALVAGRAHVAPELAPLMQRAIDLIDGRGELGEPVAQGVLSTLLLGRLRERLVAYWLDEGGPGYATACAAYERRYVASHLRKPGGIDLKVRFLAVRAPEQVAIALDIPTWQVLAPAFKKLRKIDRAAAQERVRPARAGLPLPLACYIGDFAITGYIKRLRGVTAHYVLASPMLPGPEFVNETEIGVASFGMPLGKVPSIAFSEVAYDLHVFEEQTVT